jgi:catechol 2,3-dioxygenase-like lactoylglutathione lyase family enzyme
MADVKELRLVLTVPDFDAALRFYRDTLGLDVEAVWSSEHSHVVLLSAGRASRGPYASRSASTTAVQWPTSSKLQARGASPAR